MVARIIPVRQIAYNWETNWRCLSCIIPLEFQSQNTEIKVNQYGNFTISGTNLSGLKLNEEVTVNLCESESSRYPNSYIMIGVPNMEAEGENIKIDEKNEYAFLCTLMEKSQAKYVHEAYPHFCQMIIDGKEKEIDYHKIYNVAETRLNLYIEKVLNEKDKMLFIPIAYKYGINDMKDIDKLVEFYPNSHDLEQDLKSTPYSVLCDKLKYPFNRADKLIINVSSDYKTSTERCEYACQYILGENEIEGDTRLNANVLARFIKDLTPETAKNIVEAVTNNQRIFYESSSKYSSLSSTYNAELLISNVIKNRISNPVCFDMDYTKYKNVDGFEMTEEQMEILKLANEQSVMMLTGSAGTGKSSSLKALIKMLEDYGKTYTLLAPTGIAAKRISYYTKRYASTIHKFLLSGQDIGDYLIIDETSMVGVHLLADLFSFVNKETKIVFICDEAQLASISCGNIVQDIIDSHIVPIARLTKVFRYGTNGISTIATDTRNGVFNNELNFSDYNFIQINKNPIEQIIAAYEQYKEQGYNQDDILVLSPFNKSSIGTYVINNAIQSKYNLNPDTEASYKINGNTITFKVGDKVVNTHNNYHMVELDYNENNQLIETGREVMIANGDIGTVIDYIPPTYDADGKITNSPKLIIKYDEAIVLTEGIDITNLLLGYCISVHKIQGSQAKAVICVFDKSHLSLLTRNLLYVGLSRASEKLTIISDQAVITEALKKEENKIRDTWLKELLVK